MAEKVNGVVTAAWSDSTHAHIALVTQETNKVDGVVVTEAVEYVSSLPLYNRVDSEGNLLDDIGDMSIEQKIDTLLKEVIMQRDTQVRKIEQLDIAEAVIDINTKR